MAIIYQAVNKLNGHRYIGQSKNKLNRRISEHKSACFKRIKRHRFYDAIKSYGWDNFVWSVLVTCEVSEMDYYETELISAFNTQFEDGYNDEGGGNKAKNKPGKLFGKNNPMYGKKATPEQINGLEKGRELKKTIEGRKEVSSQFKKLWADPEYREKMKLRKPRGSVNYVKANR